MRQTLIIGHRGASHDAPENTLASFRLAFEQGADGVEADFRLTRDGEIVCLHDDSTARTAGVPLHVADATLRELRGVDVGVWKGECWLGVRVPTLREVLGVLGPEKRLYLELKSGEEIVDPLAAALASSGVAPERLRILSFSAELIALVKKRLPQYRACWLADYRFRGSWRPARPEILDTLRECGADGLASRDRAAVLDESLVQALREKDMEIHVWTVDSARAARRLVSLGVDSIMTNRPGWMRNALAEQGPISSRMAGEEVR